MQLFDLINALFAGPKKWSHVERGDKKKNHFMVNRMISIQYPLQAQALNHIKIDPVSTVDFWHFFLSKIYSKVPFWVYTKGSKKVKEEKEKKTDLKDSSIKDYARVNSLDLKLVREALKFYPDQMVKEIKEFEKMIS